MKPQLVFFDLDGTLLNDKHEILDSTVNAINNLHKKGILVAIATARSKYTLDHVIESISPDIIVSSDGALIETKEERIYQSEIKSVDVRRIIDYLYASADGEIELAIDGFDAFYWNYGDIKLDSRWKNTVNFRPRNYNGEALRLCVFCSTPDYSNQIQSAFPNYQYTTFYNQPWLQIANYGINKANAVRYIAKRLNIPLDEVIAFGDDYTDCEMLDISGVGVAMGNANDTVKEHSNVVIGTNNEDSISIFLKSIMYFD